MDVGGLYLDPFFGKPIKMAECLKNNTKLHTFKLHKACVPHMVPSLQYYVQHRLSLFADDDVELIEISQGVSLYCPSTFIELIEL
jgi:hypothetical protein